MRCSLGSRCCDIGLTAVAAASIALACVLTGTFGRAQAQPAQIEAPEPKPAHAPDLKTRIALYRKQLAEYEKARRAYERVAAPYWRSITATRTKRRRKRAKGHRITLEDYVLAQPPLYTGPPEPRDPEAEHKPRPIPVVADFLLQAKAHFGFVPQGPESEIDFKRAYAKVAAAAGLTKRACVKIYGFEATGDGKYDIQAGLEYGRPGERVISTAHWARRGEWRHVSCRSAQEGEKRERRPQSRAAGEDRCALKDDPLHAQRAQRLVRARAARQDAEGCGRARAQSRHRHRAAIADAEAFGLGRIRQAQWLQGAAFGGRAGDDEPHRRRQRHRHGADAASDAREGADIELLSAARV
jgi:hypothetical protein